MARPLPKDLEDRIANTARRSEARSYGVVGFMLGTAFGAGLGASFNSAGNGSTFFLIGAVGIAVLWFFAAQRRTDK